MGSDGRVRGQLAEHRAKVDELTGEIRDRGGGGVMSKLGVVGGQSSRQAHTQGMILRHGGTTGSSR